MNPENLLKLTKIILALKAKLKCPICLDLVEKTVQLGCGHQYCSSCLQELRSQNTPLCPLCKIPINKRTAVFKDQFVDDLSKFVDRSCQLFKETYAHEVDELNTKNKIKLQEIIETAPKDVEPLSASSKLLGSAEFKKPSQNAFDKLIGQPKCYVNKKRQSEQREKRKILNFSDNDNRTKIIKWLNDNQEKLDTFTQSPSCFPATDDEADFEWPSISQVANQRKKKTINRVRSQSLTFVDNVNEPLLRRYQSLTQGLNEDDYDIDEIHSEALVKQVERKVLQDILEDECLANLEQLAQTSEKKLKKDNATLKTERKPVSKTKTCNTTNSPNSPSGWERIKKVKKTIKKAVKEPKKLNISLQESNKTKKSPKGGTKQSSAGKTATKINESPKGCDKQLVIKLKCTKAGTTADNKENEICQKKVDTNVDLLNEQPRHTFNLSAVEDYFEQNIDKVQVTPDNSTSSDLENCNSIKKLTGINLQRVKRMDEENINKENTSERDENVDDDDIYFMKTQVTPQSANQSNIICYIAPVPKEFNDIDAIAVRLADNLSSCIFSASNIKKDEAHSLVECFTNLKTYIDKILSHRSDRKEEEIQTSQIKQVNKTTRAIQTETVNVSYKAIQTKLSPFKELLTKNIQTSQNLLQNAEVQTDIAVFVNQATDHLSRRIIKENSVEKIVTDSVRYSLSSPSDALQDEINKNIPKVFKERTTQWVEPEDMENKISAKTSQSSNNKERRSRTSQKISADNSNPRKTKSGEISEESLLICSVCPTASSKPDQRINRKLCYGETQNRSFKRIRLPESDSDSDDDGKRRKRRLVRNDLTIEFVDTDRGKDDSQNNLKQTPESEKMDYDKYLLEVMAKYGTPPPERTSGNENQIRPKTKSTVIKEQIRQEWSNSRNKKSQQSNKESQKDNTKSQQSNKESQKNSGEHVFTAQVAFEENVEKFEQEIFEHEHSIKAHSTEYDLVENTPVLCSKTKIPRLQASKNEMKKNCLKGPLQILSKGSAPCCNTSERKRRASDDSLSNLTQREPSTMNKNIENVSFQTEKCTDDVAGMLKDLQNDDDFFKTNMDCDDNGQVIDDDRNRVCDNFGMDNLTTNEYNANREQLNITQDNIDEVVESFNGFEDGDDIEAELEKISFSTELTVNDSDKSRIKVLQNVKLRSQDKRNSQTKKRDAGSSINPVFENSDASDEEIVETTPQKKKNNSKNRSLDKLEEPENNSLGINLDFCLPPPPGFGDEIEASPVPDDARESPVNDKDKHPLGGNKSSLTPDSLTDFIVTPDTMMHKEKVPSTQNEYSQHSLMFKPSFVTPNRPSKDRKNALIHSTPRLSQTLASEPLDLFSPIAKNTIKFSQTKYTPLVLTSRLSTRKSNLMTSTPNQKSILNYIKCSEDSPSSSQTRPKPCIMWTRIVEKDLNVFTQLEVKKLVTTATSFNPRVTHLVVLVDEKGRIVSHTAKVLIAIAAGIWVVRYEWAQDCLKMNKIVSEEPYEALDITGIPGPQISRLKRETKPLFKGFRFYCAGPISTISKSDLENILQLSGGEIAKHLDDFLQNDGKINIIFTEIAASEDTEQFDNLLHVYKAVTVDVEWLTQCIGQYKLVSFRAFLVSGDDSIICDLGYPPTLVESVPFTLTEAM